MGYPTAAWERAMKVHEVLLKAMSGEMTWIEAAEVLGITPRSVRRWRERYERDGYDGLVDRRRRTPSPRRAPFGEVQRVLRLYREKYRSFNVRHFLEIARREHDVTFSYSFVKKVLQTAGLVPKHRPRGRHRIRREPRACFGEMLHLDGSPHPWLALCPDERQTLISVLDDATKKILYAQLVSSETTDAVMTALWAVFESHGLPMALYTDRASWAVHTPRASSAFDPDKLTQVGRALRRLGVEHILAYSPQARGRSERINRTLQDRLVNELRVAGIRSASAANRYLLEPFIPAYNHSFARSPADPTSAFVKARALHLDQILCHEEERTVAPDNTVSLDRVLLQIPKQTGRRTCSGLRVLVRRHLDGHHSISWGTRSLGSYDPQGLLLIPQRSAPATPPPSRRAMGT